MARLYSASRFLRLLVVALVIGSLSSCLPESTSPTKATSKAAAGYANRPPLLHDYYPTHGAEQDPYQGGGTNYAAFWIHPNYLTTGCAGFATGFGTTYGNCYYWFHQLYFPGYFGSPIGEYGQHPTDIQSQLSQMRSSGQTQIVLPIWFTPDLTDCADVCGQTDADPDLSESGTWPDGAWGYVLPLDGTGHLRPAQYNGL